MLPPAFLRMERENLRPHDPSPQQTGRAERFPEFLNHHKVVGRFEGRTLLIMSSLT